ncbi:putative portal protein [Citrobacter phage HCF1]|uniref:Portal protein n=1 Tax=Citrobacter phage HCF1 TaxID=2849700 RepID=A0ABX6D3K3_9CAUD|nr:putative portal protein [Citrobacter phage HCF1]
MRLDGKFIDAFAWARLLGGSGILVMLNDNRKLTSPVKEGAKLEGVVVYDRNQISVEKKVTNPRSVRYGEPEIYKITRRRLDGKFIDAFAWARLLGGSGILVMLNDNRKLTSPVKEGAKLEGVVVYDRNQISVEKKVTNPRSVRYGEPEIYKITRRRLDGKFIDAFAWARLLGGSGILVMLNDNRKLTSPVKEGAKLEGVVVYDRNQISVEKKVTNPRSVRYGEPEIYKITRRLRRKQQAVWKARDLAAMCDDDDGRYAARLRLAQVDDESGVGKAIGIDANDEEYQILNSDVTGVPEFLQEKIDRIVSLTGIHEIILKNKNTGGVSASQNTALSTFYKMIDREREDKYRPLLEFVLPFILDEEEWSVEFEPLTVPSDKEKSEILSKNVESIVKAKSEQIIDLKEARESLRSIAPEIKISDSNTIKIQEPEDIEPEPVKKGIKQCWWHLRKYVS